jgi:hypothetical protein
MRRTVGLSLSRRWQHTGTAARAESMMTRAPRVFLSSTALPLPLIRQKSLSIAPTPHSLAPLLRTRSPSHLPLVAATCRSYASAKPPGGTNPRPSAKHKRSHLPLHYQPKSYDAVAQMPLRESLRDLGYRVYGLVMHPIGMMVIFIVFISIVAGKDNRARRRKAPRPPSSFPLWLRALMLWCRVSCRVVSCRVVSCRVVSCRVVSCRVVSCRGLGSSQEKEQLVEAWRSEHDRPLKAAAAALPDVSASTTTTTATTTTSLPAPSSSS